MLDFKGLFNQFFHELGKIGVQQMDADQFLYYSHLRRQKKAHRIGAPK